MKPEMCCDSIHYIFYSSFLACYQKNLNSLNQHLDIIVRSIRALSKMEQFLGNQTKIHRRNSKTQEAYTNLSSHCHLIIFSEQKNKKGKDAKSRIPLKSYYFGLFLLH